MRSKAAQVKKPISNAAKITIIFHLSIYVALVMPDNVAASVVHIMLRSSMTQIRNQNGYVVGRPRVNLDAKENINFIWGLDIALWLSYVLLF